LIQYKINKPLRIASIDNDEFLLAIPREQVKIKINQDVLDFIQYLSDLEEFNEDIIDKYLLDESSKDDYIELFSSFQSEKLIIPVN